MGYTFCRPEQLSLNTQDVQYLHAAVDIARRHAVNWQDLESLQTHGKLCKMEEKRNTKLFSCPLCHIIGLVLSIYKVSLQCGLIKPLEKEESEHWEEVLGH